MRIRIYILVGIISFVGIGLFYASDAEALSCSLNGGISGTCKKDKCDSTEVDANEVTVIDNSLFSGIESCGSDICCIPKGTMLCQPVGAAIVKRDVEKICGVGKIPSGLTLPAYSCQGECPGSSVNANICLGGTKCCKSGTLETSVVQAACKGTPAAAASTAAPQNIKLSNPLDPQNTGVTFYTLIQKVISAFLGLVGGLALAVFMYAGIMWMTAGGDEKKVQTSKDAMRYAVMGLAMIMFAYAITSFVIDALTGSIASQQTQEVEYAQQQDLQ